MGFSLSMSGLIAAATAIDVIGNNIANSQSVGFKSSKARFADVFAAASRGSSNSIGAGVSTAIINQRFTQGGIEDTGNLLDAAVVGEGFFRLQKDGKLFYTRDGQFQVKYDEVAKTRYLASRDDYAVTGYKASEPTDLHPEGEVIIANPPVRLDLAADMSPKKTTEIRLNLNLDPQDFVDPLAVGAFDPANPDTFSSKASLEIWDADGVSHNQAIYFRYEGAGSNWKMYSSLDGAVPTALPDAIFAESGVISNPLVTLDGGVQLDLTGTTRYGAPFKVNYSSQNGYRKGDLLEGSGGFQIRDNGDIWGRFDNGQSRILGRVVLSDFINRGGLVSIGDGRWVANANPEKGTGTELIYSPGATYTDPISGKLATMGALRGGARETSNVELTNELVALIEQQRNYQASAQTFKILEDALQELAKVR